MLSGNFEPSQWPLYSAWVSPPPLPFFSNYYSFFSIFFFCFLFHEPFHGCDKNRLIPKKYPNQALIPKRYQSPIEGNSMKNRIRRTVINRIEMESYNQSRQHLLEMLWMCESGLEILWLCDWGWKRPRLFRNILNLPLAIFMRPVRFSGSY